MATQMQLQVILAGNHIATRVFKGETTKESIKTKTESGNCFCIHGVQSIKVRLIVMSIEHPTHRNGWPRVFGAVNLYPDPSELNFRLSGIHTSLLLVYFSYGTNIPVHTATKSGRNLFDI